MPKKTFPRPLTGVIVAAALLAAACGSETSAPALDTAAVGDTVTSQSSQEEAAQSETSAAPVADTEEPAETTAAPEVSSHLFPDLNTLNVKDGSSVNLATELAGGDTPVLLWFYAPH